MKFTPLQYCYYYIDKLLFRRTWPNLRMFRRQRFGDASRQFASRIDCGLCYLQTVRMVGDINPSGLTAGKRTESKGESFVDSLKK